MVELHSGQFGPYTPYVAGAYRSRWGFDALLMLAAHRRFERAQRQAKIRQLWARIGRHSRCLFDLNHVHCATADRHYVGLRVAPLDSIRGSEGRCRDFDCDFLPLQPALAERWVSVYMAISKGVPMQPVTLIRAGEVYFVRDGHHRISVARVQGRPDIEAEVTVWNVQMTAAPVFVPSPARSFQPANLSAL